MGFLLTFAILSILLVGSMITFNVAAQRAEERTVAVQMESAAARVAGLIVQTSLLAEQQGANVALAYTVELPQELEGRDYDIRVEAAAASGSQCRRADEPDGPFPDQVCVIVPSLDLYVKAPVFSAAAPTNVKICTTEVAGGEILVRYDAKTAVSGGCPGVPAGIAKAIFLQAS